MRKILLVFLSVVMVVLMIVPVFAAEGQTVQPLYHSISSIYVWLNIDQNTSIVTAAGSVSAYYEVPVEVLVQLQVYKNGGWQTLRSWSNSGTGDAYISGQYTVESGYNYRTKVTGSVCNDLGIPVESEVGTKEVYYPAS